MSSTAWNDGLQGVVADLQSKIEQLDDLSKAAAERLYLQMIEAINEVHPGRSRWSTGLLASILKKGYGPKKEGTTWWIGFGPYELLGTPDEQAPKGTIRDFLEYLRNTWYPQRAEMAKEAKRIRSLEARRRELDASIGRVEREIEQVKKRIRVLNRRAERLADKESEAMDKAIVHAARGRKPRPGAKTWAQRAEERQRKYASAAIKIVEAIYAYQAEIAKLRERLNRLREERRRLDQMAAGKKGR